MANFMMAHLSSVLGKGLIGAAEKAMAWSSPALTAVLETPTEDILDPPTKTKPKFPENIPTKLLTDYSRDKDLSDYYDNLAVSWWEDMNKAKLGGYVEEEDGSQVWHGATRVPSEPNEGLLLKMIGDTADTSHPTYILGLLGEINHGFNLYTANEGFFADRVFSFPQNRPVDPKKFTPVSKERIDKWLDMPFDYEEIADYVLPNEVVYSKWVLGDRPGLRGGKYYVYDGPKEGEIDIGIGHLIDPKVKSSIQFTKAQLASIGLSHIDVDALSRGEIGLTEDEMMRLFMSDIREKKKTAERTFPDLYMYPSYVQAAIIDGFFWSMLPKSPKTVKLIKEGKLKEAGDEFLDNSSYKKNLNKPRFHRFRDAMYRWADEGGE